MWNQTLQEELPATEPVLVQASVTAAHFTMLWSNCPVKKEPKSSKPFLLNSFYYLSLVGEIVVLPFLAAFLWVIFPVIKQNFTNIIWKA